MLYTKFQSHWPLCSEEGDFLRFLPNNGRQLGQVTRKFEHIIIPASHGFKRPCVFSEEKKFENVDTE